jgi:hypothetical protein
MVVEDNSCTKSGKNIMGTQGTMKVRNVYNTGCVVDITFSDCFKTGFVTHPKNYGDRLTLEIEEQRRAPLYISEYPEDWKEIGQDSCKCVVDTK